MVNNKDIENLTSNIDLFEVRAELFRRGDYSFIVDGIDKDGNKVTHEKQKEVLTLLMSGKYDEILYGGAAGGAKAQPLDAKIYTPFGYKLMGDIQVGDVIKSPTGGNTNVIAVHPQGKKKIYEVQFIDGVTTKCCGDHLWKVWYSSLTSKQEAKKGRGRIRTTEMLISELERGKRPIIPLTEPVEFDSEYINPIILFDNINRLTEHSSKERIAEILYSPIKSRWIVANMLIQRNGALFNRFFCLYKSKNEILIDVFRSLLFSLGFKVKKNKVDDVNSCFFELIIQGKNLENLASYDDGIKTCESNNDYGREIISIKEVGYEEAQCITVDSLDRLYLTDNYIVTHNTWTGCVWILFMSYLYPGIKSFIGRNELGDLVDSVKVTFDKVCRAYGFTDYKFNAQKNFIQLGNTSHINFIEVKFMPSDPNYEDVGSTEYTIGWGEEVGEWHENAALVMSTRVGRHLNEEDYHGKLRENPIKGTILWTCNPNSGWSRREFYEKDKNGTLEEGKKYIQCLITENPFIEKDYIEKLRNLSTRNKSIFERLFKGNWDYQDNPFQLAEQEMIDMVFDNNHVKSSKKYITADIARFGSDKARIGVWDGWNLIEVVSFDISKTTEIELAILTLRRKYNIPKNRCIADQDGVGCISIHTEVLTNRGWIMGKDITMDDVIISKDENDYLEYTGLEDIHYLENELFIETETGYKFTETHAHFYKTRKGDKIKKAYWDDITELKAFYNDTFSKGFVNNNATVEFEDTIIYNSNNRITVGKIKKYFDKAINLFLKNKTKAYLVRMNGEIFWTHNGGVVDGAGILGFNNNGRPIKQKGKDENYRNLQIQCLYLLADKINEGGLNISADITTTEKTEIKEELAQIQSKGNHDPTRKLDCKSKADIKADIGRSPDWRDLILMRVYFDLKSSTNRFLLSRVSK